MSVMKARSVPCGVVIKMPKQRSQNGRLPLHNRRSIVMRMVILLVGYGVKIVVDQHDILPIVFD
jgi:hypothetical protein